MDTSREPLIEFKGVSKTFGDRNILNRIDLSVYEGEVTTLIGLSGTGTSTSSECGLTPFSGHTKKLNV